MNKNENIRDAFFDGLQSALIGQRLLETSTLFLEDTVSQARAIELAKQQSQQNLVQSSVTGVQETSEKPKSESIYNIKRGNNNEPSESEAAISLKCYFCGLVKHSRAICSAKNTICRECGVTGNFHKVYR